MDRRGDQQRGRRPDGEGEGEGGGACIRVPLLALLGDICICCAMILWMCAICYLLTPSQRGFFCDDDSIRYPYKRSTVPDSQLLPWSTLLPVLVVTATELGLGKWGPERGRRAELRAGDRFWAAPAWAARWLRAFVAFVHGYCVEWVLTEAAKFAVGRQRPHFLDACRPVVATGPAAGEAACGGVNGSDTHEYVTNYRCTGDPNIVFQARLSFPSGHSSISFYAAVFLILYVERRVRWFEPRRLQLATLQMFALAVAGLCALSRIHDNKHHWSDVLCGSLLGAAVGWWTVARVLRPRPDADPDSDSNCSDSRDAPEAERMMRGKDS